MQKFIQTRVKDADADGVVLGLSGGIDSATTLSLAVSALGAKNVSGLIMPFKDSESITLALDHANSLSVETKTYDISEIVNSYKGISKSFINKNSEGNLHSRIRMSLLYGEAFSSTNLVIGKLLTNLSFWLAITLNGEMELLIFCLWVICINHKFIRWPKN